MRFHEKLRLLIEERNMTQKQLAKDLNIAPSTMGGYVQGSSEPDFETLKKLADYFMVSTDYLLSMPTAPVRNPLEEELLRVFRALTDEQQFVFIEQGKAFIRMNLLQNKRAMSS